MDAITPGLTDADRLQILEPPEPTDGPLDMVLDTDTYNEIDDQFALAYALLSPERLRVQAVYAAPFDNEKSDGPESGMLASYAEILRVLQRVGHDPDGFAFEGSRRWLSPSDGPRGVESPAATDLIRRARSRPAGQPLYVVAIGAPTNVASALVQAPDIADSLVVVWLGGNPVDWHPGAEFNVYQDVCAARVLLGSGVPLVHVPCVNVTEHLRTTLAEVDRFVRPCGALGGYLAEIFRAHRDDHFATSKELWDVGAIAWLINPGWTPSVLVHSPLLNEDRSWSRDPARHLIREVRTLDRDLIFGDLFRKLAAHG